MEYHHRQSLLLVLLLLLPLLSISAVEPRELRPSEHGLDFHNNATAAAESPEMSAFFGGTTAPNVLMPEARNFSGEGRDDRRRGGGGGHVRKAWLVGSLVCGLSGVVLLIVAASLYVVVRLRNNNTLLDK